MTHHPITVLADGTRVYSNGTKYKPVEQWRRKYGMNKPDDPRAVLWSSRWWLPLELLPDDDRTMPLTRPDTDAYDHFGKRQKCRCDVCRRPEAQRWKDKRMRELRPPRQIRSESLSGSTISSS